MAERRMFAKTVIDSDAFLEMPVSSQALYFHLGMRADDDGFVNSPKKILRMVGASDDDLKLLIAKSFIIPFDSGIIVIKHWRLNNYIRNDRYKPTVYEEEKESLGVKDNGAYTLGIPNGNQWLTQDSIDKVSKDKNKNIYGEFKNVQLTDDEFSKLKERFPNDYLNRIENLSSYLASKNKKYKSHYATILNWSRKETKNEPTTNSKYAFAEKDGLDNF